jgi:zinc protease
MSAVRFDWPVVGAPAPVHLPPIERSVLANGMRVWTMPHRALPVVALSIFIDRGTGTDPEALPGLTSLMAGMLDEGAGGRDAIQLAEALGDLGGTIDISSGPDATSISIWTLTRHLPAAVRLLSDVLARPTFRAGDLERVREMRLSRLQQLRRSPAAGAERVFARAVFGAHGYAHSNLGTSAAIATATLDDVTRRYREIAQPGLATVLAAGDVSHGAVVDAVTAALGAWSGGVAHVPPARAPLPRPGGRRVCFVERPDAPQSEVRVGHLGVARVTPDYHRLVLLNAGLGGSFSGRMNQRLRQQLGYTYGARSGFDMDRLTGSFVAEASVQGDKTADSVAEMIALIEGVRGAQPIDGPELDLARATLTRGFARHFETPRQLAGAMAQIAIYQLPDDTFDTFVPAIEAVSAAEVQDAAARYLHPDSLVVVVAGDPQWRDALAAFGPVETVTPEF